jgi:hypothetical protein
MSTTPKVFFVAAALITSLSLANSVFALNPQPEAPNIPQVPDGPRKPGKTPKIKAPPPPCKTCR